MTFLRNVELAISAQGGGGASKEVRSIRIWNTETGSLVSEIAAHRSTIECVDLTTDGRLIASGGMDRAIRIWNTRTGELVAEVQTQNHVTNRLAFSPDGRFLLSGSGQGWDHDSNQAAPDGDYAVRLWRLPETVFKNPN